MTWNLSTALPDSGFRFSKVLVAVSADPWTHGHTELVRAATVLAPKVVVAVGIDDARTYVLPQKLRAALARDALAGQMPASAYEIITPPDGQSIVETVVAHHCDSVVRGARDAADLRLELRRRQVSDDIFPGIGACWGIWTPDSDPLLQVSATRMRDAMHNGVFLPDSVCSYRAQRALRFHMRGERVALLMDTSPDGSLRRDVAAWFNSRPDPAAAQILYYEGLPEVPAPRWGWQDPGDKLAIQMRAAVGKARASVRILCIDAPFSADLGVMLRACHGVLMAYGQPGEIPFQKSVENLGGMLLPVWYEGGKIQGVDMIFRTF